MQAAITFMSYEDFDNNKWIWLVDTVFPFEVYSQAMKDIPNFHTVMVEPNQKLNSAKENRHFEVKMSLLKVSGKWYLI